MKTMLKNLFILVAFLFASHIASANENLLQPTGAYGVGFQDFRLVDGTMINGSYTCPGKTDLLYRKNKNEKDFGQDNQVDFCREIMLRVYYPIQEKYPPRENYYTPRIHDIQDQLRALHIPGITEEQILDLVNIKIFATNLTNKDPNIAAGKFPVLLFDPGCTFEVEEYENIVAELVSNGYIVLGINNTFLASDLLFPDGRVVNFLDPPENDGDPSVLHDVLFVRQLLNAVDHSVLSLFTSHMDLTHIGLFGHSMGGISTIEAVRKYPDIVKAAVSLDSPPTIFGARIYSPAELAGLNIPFMRMFAAAWRNIDGFITPKDAKFELLENNYYALMSPNEDNITYTGHLSFNDCSTLQYQSLLKYLIPQEAVGTADGWRMAKLINTYILEFFNQYLKGIPSTYLTKCQSVANDTLLSCGNHNKSESNSSATTIGIAVGSAAALIGTVYLGTSQENNNY